MRYRLLGRSGLRVSELCLGTMTFGQEVVWGAPREECQRIFDAFVAAGGNFVDTANNYTGGSSEKLVGEFVRADRAKFVVGTKFTMNSPTGDPNFAGNQRKNMVQSLESSLRRLRMDYVDILWVHAWDPLTPTEELMRGLDDLVRAGKVLYVGISNAPAWVIARANTLSELRGWTSFVGLQVSYSLIERTPERDLLPMARALDIGVTAWSPLGSGLLSGKYNSPRAAEPRRLDNSQAVTVDERNLAVAAVVHDVATSLDCSPAQVALAWVWRQGVIPIIGARTLGQFEDNLKCREITLADDHLRRLDEASRVDLGYPHDFLGRKNIQTSVFGGMLGQIDSPLAPR